MPPYSKHHAYRFCTCRLTDIGRDKQGYPLLIEHHVNRRAMPDQVAWDEGRRFNSDNSKWHRLKHLYG
jgi:hypothetical protein